MADTTIFKLEDLDIDLFENHTIKVKSKKNNDISSFSNILNYTGIPHYNVTVNNMFSNPSGGNSVELYDGIGDDKISRGYVAYQESKTIPITQGKIYVIISATTFENIITGEKGNPYTVSSDVTLNLIEASSN